MWNILRLLGFTSIASNQLPDELDITDFQKRNDKSTKNIVLYIYGIWNVIWNCSIVIYLNIDIFDSACGNVHYMSITFIMMHL